MGLSLEVGYLADLKQYDEESFTFAQSHVEAINGILIANGLPAHHEPEEVERGWGADLFGYSGLHYLRRIAAHLRINNSLPEPGNDNADSDPILTKLYQDVGGGQYQHLIYHSDTDGFYLPIQFDDVLISGRLGMIGSSYRLQNELRQLMSALEIPAELSIEDELVWIAAENQGKGHSKWEQYGIETHTCLTLMEACKQSIQLQAVIAFV